MYQALSHFSVLIATESWAGPGNEARPGMGLFPIRRLGGGVSFTCTCGVWVHTCMHILSIYLQIHYTRYIFSELLSQEIPKLRTSIEDQSRAELTVRVT